MRYKNEGVDSKELRRRREEEGIQLRKQKRDIQLFKRRNINETIQPDDNEVSTIDAVNAPRSLKRVPTLLPPRLHVSYLTYRVIVI